MTNNKVIVTSKEHIRDETPNEKLHSVTTKSLKSKKRKTKSSDFIERDIEILVGTNVNPEEGERITIRAFTCKNVAYHKTVTQEWTVFDTWTITHIGSGLKIISYRERQRAVYAACLLANILPENISKEDIQLKDKILKVLNLVNTHNIKTINRKLGKLS